MDQLLLKELAQFKVMLKRATGVSADIERLISDPSYGKATLAAAEESDNEQLVFIAIELKDKLGLLPQPMREAPAAPAGEDHAHNNKYIRGVRG